jgi:hypothetical protein
MGKRPTLPRLQGLPRIDGKPRRRCPACGRCRPCRRCRPAVAVLPLPLCRPRNRLPCRDPTPRPAPCRADAVRLVSLRTLPPPRCPVRLYRAGRRAMPCRCRQGVRIAVRPYELPPYPVRLADVARGLPVITSAGGGASHVIKEGSNFLTDCR